MASSGLQGPYILTTASIDILVTRKSAGAYALGQSKEGIFYISYVGRSDNDIEAGLKKHAGNYEHFKFDYFSSASAAFDKECNLYHDFDPPDNTVHPDRPVNTNWKCPRCALFNF